MADNPRSVPEHAKSRESDPSCPFCSITATYRPISPLDPDNTSWDPERLSPPAYVLLSTPHAIAFLDIAPLTRGHVLIAPRYHRAKVGDLSPSEASEIGRVLPIVARAVLGATLPDIPHAEADYNVVQNNGPGAAQVIPHVHFHVIPRPPLDYQPPMNGNDNGNGNGNRNSTYAPAKVPTGLRASYVQFGRGQRHELDDDEAAVLVKEIRERLKDEWRNEFGTEETVPEPKETKL